MYFKRSKNDFIYEQYDKYTPVLKTIEDMNRNYNVQKKNINYSVIHIGYPNFIGGLMIFHTEWHISISWFVGLRIVILESIS